jgi:hypothetical protein
LSTIEKNIFPYLEQFEDTKGVVRSCKSKKDIQHKFQKRDKNTNKALRRPLPKDHMEWENDY